MNTHPTALLSALACAALVTACGGGGSAETAADAVAQPTAQSLPAAPTAVAAPLISPMYELADLRPPVPSDVDADGSNTSAQSLPAADGRSHALAAAGGESASTYYTPAQIRAAYGLDKLDGTATTPASAYLGAGQTIAIITAFHSPDVANDLAVFSQKFGLAACGAQTLGAATALPLPRPSAAAGCSFVVAYATAAGTLTSQAPATDAAWRTEGSLDVEWAHAIAPLARIILVEAASASREDLLGAVKLAGKLGASVVSMSFASAEYAGQADYDSAFTAPGVTYVAASGDNGRGVSWPAVSTQVLAVGGSTLGYASGARSESAWLGSGGGISSFNAAPAWQAALTVMATSGKVGTPTRRAVPDVAFNASPKSGQLIYVTPTTPGDTGWFVAGGTSLGTPQWAGLIAIANAVRASAGKGLLGAVAAPLYKAMAGSGGSVAAPLQDVVLGSNGNCMGCGATPGYDLVTGLGTPDAGRVIDLMVGF